MDERALYGIMSAGAVRERGGGWNGVCRLRSVVPSLLTVQISLV
jgi:hypothetical protein